MKEDYYLFTTAYLLLPLSEYYYFTHYYLLVVVKYTLILGMW